MNDSTLSFRYEEEEMLIPDAFKSVSSVAVSVVALTSVIGNILVITTFFKTQNLRISTNYYITSIAVSDLLFIITNWPLYLCIADLVFLDIQCLHLNANLETTYFLSHIQFLWRALYWLLWTDSLLSCFL